MKTCGKCSISKTDDQFTARKLSADGLHPWCRECKNAVEVARRAPIRAEINRSERARYAANPEPYRAKEKRRMADSELAARKIESQRRWLAANPDKTREYSARHYEKNIEERRRASREFRRANREVFLPKMRQFQKENRAAFTAYQNLRHAGKLAATPKWLTEDHKAFMALSYAMANELSKQYGIKFHVDHIHPLRGENVCGLHVPWNLQVLPAYDNQSKGNRLRAA